MHFFLQYISCIAFNSIFLLFETLCFQVVLKTYSISEFIEKNIFVMQWQSVTDKSLIYSMLLLE